MKLTGPKVLAALSAGGATAIVVFQAITTHWIDRNNHCGFDGTLYCAMANGQRVIEPYSRRVLLPFIVRLLHFGPMLIRFEAVNIVCVLISCVVVGIVAVKLSTSKDRAGGILAGSLLAISPWTFHIVFSYPAVTDELMLAMFLLWIWSALSRSWLSVLPAMLAVMAHESAVVPILIGSVLLWRRTKRATLWSGVNVAAGVGAFVLVLTRPAVAGGGIRTDVLALARWWASQNFLNGERELQIVWLLLSGIGITWVFLIGSGRWLIERNDRWALIPMAIGTCVAATFGGGDTDRLSLPALGVLVPLGIAAAFDQRSFMTCAVACFATAVLWQPWQIVQPQMPYWLYYFSMRDGQWVLTRSRIYTFVAFGSIPLATSVLANRAKRLVSRQSTV